ncbi:MAG TPA: DASS family sodium-coupled anion symporter [Intrasporangiaceae bacterium]|nr:DASS family sodium-coupled anion symporter [Intrasporangiaceae bacterium]
MGARTASVQDRPRTRSRRPRLRLTLIQRIGLTLAVLVAPLPLILDVPGLEPVGQRMFAIFLLAIILWVTEAVPLVATAVLVIFLEVLLISDQALLPVPDDVPTAASFYATLANPVVILFLGGFLIADAAAKYGLDKNLAAVLLRPFQANARITALGLMLITAVLSMFMSNTATTATMFAVLIPVLMALPDGVGRTGFALSIPVAANIGGIATPVGSPPNAIALAALNERGETITFLGWMLLALPLMLILLAAAWWLITWRFVPRDLSVDLDLDASFDTRPRALMFYVVAGITVVLWLTEPIHGIPSTTVGFFPVVVLLLTQVMSGEDIKVLQWPVLWLVAGGIALGSGVGSSGLDQWLIGLVSWSALPQALILATLTGIALILGTVISNSATANLLIPIAMGLSLTVGLDPKLVAVVLALVCGLGMALPISTPPNAIAYATGEVTTGQMAGVGVAIGLLGMLLLTAVMPAFWSAVGLL